MFLTMKAEDAVMNSSTSSLIAVQLEGVDSRPPMVWGDLNSSLELQLAVVQSPLDQ